MKHGDSSKYLSFLGKREERPEMQMGAAEDMPMGENVDLTS